jgi:riboflavin kinase/FMN adenylyltransferase
MPEASPTTALSTALTTALTIGNFDGVHLGHQALVRRCRELVGAKGRVVVLAFDPHPMSRLRPGFAPPRITPFEQRQALLEAAGADSVVRLPPTDDLLAKTAEEFVEWFTKAHSPAVVVEGADFHFGKGRGGNTDLLARLGPSHGFRCVVEPPVEVTLSDHLIARASSSLLRFLLAHGRVRDAAIVTGRPHRLAATVVKGDQLGRTIGFPTANLASETLLPADGVYAGLAHVPTIGQTFAAAVNIGTRPTVSGVDRRVEAHLLLDSQGTEWSPLPGLPEYGWAVELELIARVRDQVRFPGLDALRGQLVRDISAVRRITGQITGAMASATV